MIKGRDIVCLSFVTWDDHWGTPQQWMSRLAKHNRVLFVDQPISPLSFFTGIRGRGAVARQFRRWRQGYREVAKNVYAAAPPPILPMRYLKPVNMINAWIVRRWLARQAARLRLHEPIFWNFQPGFPNISSAVAPSLSIYHCVDEFSAVPYWWHPGAAVRAREAECCRESDVVLCTGRKLVESRRRLNSNIHFVPEGADIELFASAMLPATVAAPEVTALRGKVVGYIGVIDFRLDTALLAHVARSRPEWAIALVGPVKGDAQDLAALTALPNVHLFPRQPIERLPAYVKAMDVCTIPYILNDYTHHIFPLKLYEYMAAGKPIVATDMEEMRPYAGHTMAIARSHEEFLSAVDAALASDSPARAEERSHAARSESWDHRVEEGSAIIGPLLDARDRVLRLPDRHGAGAAAGGG